MLVSQEQSGIQINNPVVIKLLNAMRPNYYSKLDWNLELTPVVEKEDTYEAVIKVIGIPLSKLKGLKLKDVDKVEKQYVPVTVNIKKDATKKDDCYEIVVEDERYVGSMDDFSSDLAYAETHALNSMLVKSLKPIQKTKEDLKESRDNKIRLALAGSMVAMFIGVIYLEMNCG
jgi:hypothetical protein